MAEPLARRLAALHAEHEQLTSQIAASPLNLKRRRIEVEIAGLENGTLLWVEQRAHLPDRERTPRAFADSYGIGLTTAQDRLRRLWRAGILKRVPIYPGPHSEGGRRVYSYKPNDDA